METGGQLPEDVTMNILLRLPVKSLLQFRSVCKSWCAVLKSPFFITKHLHTCNKLTSDGYYPLASRYDCDKNEYVFSILSPRTLDISLDVNMDFLNVTNTVVGVCNGILCLHGNGHSMALWNFATKEFKSLRLSQVSRPPDTVDDIIIDIGFGFDSNTNDYKVVRTLQNFKEDHSFIMQVELYSLSTNSWREIQAGLPESICTYLFLTDTWLNGAHHWLAEDEEKNTHMILSFDMGAEVFKTMDLPSYIIHFTFVGAVLGLLYGSLALVVYPSDPQEEVVDEGLDVWVMNDYGVDESWTKLFSIASISGIERPLGFWKNGELLMESRDGQLVKYDPATQQAKYLRVQSGGRRVLQVIIYMESLVPINGEQRLVQLWKA